MKGKKDKCNRQCFMCRLCVPGWQEAIDAHQSVISYKKNEVILSEGTQVSGMYFVLNGLVKVHKQWGENKEIILRIATNGEILGHRGLGYDDLYPISATALEPTTVCFVSLDFFQTTLSINHQFLYELMMFFAAELKVSERKMRDMSHLSVKSRLAQSLLAFRKKFGANEQGVIGLQLSRADLAAYVGATYETISRTLQEMAEQKLLAVDGKQICIKNESAMLELLGD